MSEDDTKLMAPPSSFTPELQSESPKSAQISYRFMCPGPGRFQCSSTGLVFVMAQKTELVYKAIQWNESVLQPSGKIPAGLLFKIQCPEDAVCQLHLPHCETKDAEFLKSLLSVVHITDDGMSILKPLEITDTHVIVTVSHFSAFGIVRAFEVFYRFFSNPCPVHGQVLLFLRPPNLNSQRQNLHLVVLSRNVPLEEVRRRHQDSVYIPAPLKCLLFEDQHYTVDCPTAFIVQPKKADFDLDFGPNYHPTFEIRLSTSIKVVTIALRDQKNTDVWKHDVDLTGPGPEGNHIFRHGL
ncbi:uncharacterized protein [Trachinotus anak]